MRRVSQPRFSYSLKNYNHHHDDKRTVILRTRSLHHHNNYQNNNDARQHKSQCFALNFLSRRTTHTLQSTRFYSSASSASPPTSRSFPVASSTSTITDTVTSQQISALRQLKSAVTKLSSRGLISVSGEECSVLLQNIMTNDIHKLHGHGISSIYAHFLGPQGRVLFEGFIHNTDRELRSTSYIVDIDKQIMAQALRHFKMYSLRMKVSIEDASQRYQVWSVLGKEEPKSLISNLSETDMIIEKDARNIDELGYRILAPAPFLPSLTSTVSLMEDEKVYGLNRIINGIPEASIDFPWAKCIPLEQNLEYMNGVSFNKGCYLGQELTARTHHRGIVRKRVCPILAFPNNTTPTKIKETISTIESETKSNSNFLFPKSLLDNLTGDCIINTENEQELYPIKLPTENPTINASTPEIPANPAKSIKLRSTGEVMSGMNNVYNSLIRLDSVSSVLTNTNNQNIVPQTSLLFHPLIPVWWTKHNVINE